MAGRMKHRTAFVLQGGGALGAYQAGAACRLAEAGVLPDLVAGISIGAINAALIAGNPPERRADRLTRFWGRADLGHRLAGSVGPWHGVGADGGGAGLFCATLSARALCAGGRPDTSKLLRHRAFAPHAGGSGRFRPSERRPGAAGRGGDLCCHRQFHLV